MIYRELFKKSRIIEKKSAQYLTLVYAPCRIA